MKDLDRVERELPSQLEEVANTVGIARMTRSAVDERVEERGGAGACAEHSLAPSRHARCCW